MAALAAGLRLEEGERITLDVVDELLEVALEVVKDHKARAQVVPFLVDFVKQQALNALEVSCRREAGVDPSRCGFVCVRAYCFFPAVHRVCIRR